VPPLLDLTVEDVGPNRTREALARLEATMLFPDVSAKAARVAYFGAARATIEVMSADTAAISAGFVPWLANAPDNLDSLSEQIRRRFIVGLLLGRMVAEMVCDGAREKTIEDVCQDLEKEFNRGPDVGFRVNQLSSNWWNQFGFRKVGHLWAATCYLEAWTPRRVFPCALIDLPAYLAAAEYCLFRAKRRRLLAQGEKTLLDETTYRVPLELACLLPISPVAIRSGEICRRNKRL
jgi:hypothetical protein